MEEVTVEKRRMRNPEDVKVKVRAAFADVRYPGDARLCGSNEGFEPFEVEEVFRGKNDWRCLSAEFIDDAPNGLASALSFFSDEAFRFYLPAYLIADIDGLLKNSDPLFHLTYGLERSSASKCINPKRYGSRTWNERAREQFEGFTTLEAQAIVAYLEWKCEAADTICFEREAIKDALATYWLSRARG